MAYGAAPVESGGDKLHFLTPDGNTPAGWFGVDTGVTGTGGNTVAFAAIATHVHDDAASSPGGLPTTSVPLVLVGGVRDDALGGLTPAAGDAVYLLVDADGALWTHDNALDAALAGTELQVDIVAPLPTGSNAIGKLAANSGVDIGDVDVATMPGTAAEAAALPAVFVVVAGDDGVDTHPLQLDAGGLLKMSIDADTVGIGGGTQFAVDDPLGATPTGMLALARRDDALGGLTPAADDAIALRVDANGALWTHDDVLEAALAGSELQVDVITMPSVAVTNAGLSELADAINASRMDVNIAASVALDVSAATVTVDTELAAAVALADTVANPTVPVVGAFLVGWNETTWDRLVSSIVNGLEVDVTRVQGSVAVTHTGLTDLAAAINANRMDVNLAASIALDVSAATVIVDLAGNNDVLVDGSIAHDALDSGGLGPVKIGGRAQSSEAQPEEVADNDRVDALFDRSGYLRVRGDFDPQFADVEDSVNGNNTIVAAQAAGKRIAVWSILLVADGTVDVRWEDGAAGTAFTGQIPLQAREGYSMSAGGIVPLFVGTAATLLNLELNANIVVHGFVSYTVMDD